LQAQGIGLQSSLQDIDAAMRATGFFWYSHHYLKDCHFKQHVLPLGLHDMEDVQSFLERLDTDSRQQARHLSNGCTKAYVARNWLTSRHRDCTTPLAWAITGLARARRTCCGCHDTGSFHPSN
jgi:hypothetical protein